MLTDYSFNGKGIICDYALKSEVMMISFGGIYGGIGIPLFEFFKIGEKLKAKKLFIRDLQQVWYQGGIPEVGENVFSIAEFIKTQFNDQGCKKIIMVGNSAGGYASLFFGRILHADKVLAFSPQTFLNFKERMVYFDYRWSKQIINMYRTPGFEKSTINLANLYSKTKNTNSEFHIYYSREDRLDTIHAKRMSKFNNIFLHSFDHGGHELVKRLRDENILFEILSSAISD